MQYERKYKIQTQKKLSGVPYSIYCKLKDGIVITIVIECTQWCDRWQFIADATWNGPALASTPN